MNLSVRRVGQFGALLFRPDARETAHSVAEAELPVVEAVAVRVALPLARAALVGRGVVVAGRAVVRLDEGGGGAEVAVAEENVHRRARGRGGRDRRGVEGAVVAVVPAVVPAAPLPRSGGQRYRQTENEKREELYPERGHFCFVVRVAFKVADGQDVPASLFFSTAPSSTHARIHDRRE